MWSVFLVSDVYEQRNSSISQSDIIRIETLHEHKLPPIKALSIDFSQLLQTAYSKIFHVIVAVVKELVHCLHCLFE